MPGTVYAKLMPRPAASYHLGYPGCLQPEAQAMAEPRPIRVLVVDDEPVVVKTLEYGLHAAGYVVATAHSGEEALGQLYRQLPDVVLLDRRMPGMDGLETCRQIHHLREDVPIIMVAGLVGEQEIEEGLDAGADDYVAKPFRMPELLARIRAVIRRKGSWSAAGAGGRGRHAYDGERLVLDLDKRQVEVDGRVVPLSPLEYKLLEYLAANQGRVLSQRQILEHVWGPEYVDEPNYVKVYVNTLRQKIEPNPAQPRYVIARRGLGYMFAAE